MEVRVSLRAKTVCEGVVRCGFGCEYGLCRQVIVGHTSARVRWSSSECVQGGERFQSFQRVDSCQPFQFEIGCGCLEMCYHPWLKHWEAENKGLEVGNSSVTQNPSTRACMPTHTHHNIMDITRADRDA